MNGFQVYKIIEKPKNESDYRAEDLYLKLLENQNKTVNDILLNKPTDKCNEKIYLQTKTLFNSNKQIFKKLFNKGIIRNDSDQLHIKHEENISERTKLRRHILDKIKEKEHNIHSELFKKYFNYESPNNMYNILSNTKNKKNHNALVNLTKSSLFD